MAVQLQVEMLRIYPLKMFTSYCFSMKIFKCEFIPNKGWQFSCHLITGRNVKDFLPEKVLPLHCFSMKVYTTREGSSTAT